MLVLLALLACTPDPPRAPDVVVVVVDTLRADGPSYAGNPRPTTPTLDALATSEATWFSRAGAASSWTLPSFATILTGLYPWQHRVTRTLTTQELYGRLDAAIPTLASVYHERGYRTAAIVNNAFLAPVFGLNRAFDLYDYKGAYPNEHRSAADSVAAALAWMQGSEAPAFALIHIMEPHFEYMAPEPFRGKFSAEMPHNVRVPVGSEIADTWMRGLVVPPLDDQLFMHARYDEEVLAVDSAIAQLIAGLKAQQRWENTIFVVTADHGEEHWDRGQFEHGHTLRSVLTHVPLLVRAPGFVPGRNDTIVDHTDLYQFLTTGGGVLAEVARAGEHRRGEVAFSQDLLYAPPAVSAADEDRRIIVHMANMQAELWALDEGWTESEALHTQPERRSEGGPLFAQLEQKRGGFVPTEPYNPVDITKQEVFDMLRELGYVD